MLTRHALQGSVGISLFEAHQNCLVADLCCHCYHRSPFASRTHPTAEQNSFGIQSHPPFHARLHTCPFSFSHTSNLIFEATVELCRYLFLMPWNQVSLGFLVLRHNQQCPWP